LCAIDDKSGPEHSFIDALGYDADLFWDTNGDVSTQNRDTGVVIISVSRFITLGPVSTMPLIKFIVCS
jgi:hypothetical protein